MGEEQQIKLELGALCKIGFCFLIRRVYRNIPAVSKSTGELIRLLSGKIIR